MPVTQKVSQPSFGFYAYVLGEKLWGNTENVFSKLCGLYGRGQQYWKMKHSFSFGDFSGE